MAEKTILKEQMTKIGEEEGLTTKADCRVNTPGDLYYNRPADFVIERTMIYSCYRCKDPYYTGLLNDFEAALRENIEAQNFLCMRCACDHLGYG